MRARFDVELSGVYDFEREQGESCEQALAAVREIIRASVEHALLLAPGDRTWLDPLTLDDVSFGAVEYDDEDGSLGKAMARAERAWRRRNHTQPELDLSGLA